MEAATVVVVDTPAILLKAADTEAVMPPMEVLRAAEGFKTRI